jgi:hypothetical protein
MNEFAENSAHLGSKLPGETMLAKYLKNRDGIMVLRVLGISGR